MQMLLKILNGKADSVDPDQTAPFGQSDLGLHWLQITDITKIMYTPVNL